MNLAELSAHKLSFGKYAGTPLGDAPIDYVVWLAGKRVNENLDNPITHSVLEDLVDVIWMNRDAPCGCKKRSDELEYHLSSCYNTCLGVTRNETKQKCRSKILNEEATFLRAKMMRSWIWVERHHPGEVARAWRYLKLSHKCYACGRKLVAVGHERANGRDHADWQERKLHKKCWKELED